MPNLYWDLGRSKKKDEGQRVVLSLRDLCVGVLARHFDAIETGFFLEPQLYIDMLSHPDCRASPSAVNRLETAHPELVSEVTDSRYWKQRQLCLDAAQRDITPLPEARRRLTPLHDALRRWLQDETKEKDQRRVQQIQIAISGRLERFPMTVELLSASRIGVTLAAVVKRISRDHARAQRVNKQASNLLNKWKSTLKKNSNDDSPDSYLFSRLGSCSSWKSLFFLLSEANGLRYKRFIKKRDSLLQAAAAQKHDIISIEPSEAVPPTKRQRFSASSPPTSITTVNNVSKAPSLGGRRT